MRRLPFPATLSGEGEGIKLSELNSPFELHFTSRYEKRTPK